MGSIRYSCEIPVLCGVDVCVVGGGPAGLSAAVTAARGGLSVFLCEGHTCFGGMGSAGMVPAFMTISDGERVLIKGFGEYFLKRLSGEDGTAQDLHIKAEVLKRVCDELVEESGISYRFMSTLVDVMVEDGQVTHGIFNGKSGLFAIAAKVFIDGTGDGDLSVMAGASYQLGSEDSGPMPGTLCSLWCNVDYDRYRAAGKAAREYLPQAFKDGVFRTNDPHHPGMWKVGDGITGGNFGHIFGLDSTDADSLTAGLVEGRKQLPEFQRFYRTYVPGFERCQLVGSGSLLGVRESRRIEGEYTLTLDDYTSKASFPDEIGRYCYPIDIHISKPSQEAYGTFLKQNTTLVLKRGESYGIPLRVLLPKNTRNVLCAGRCVSTDRYVQSSLRVMPGCMITGQGAGLAAVASLTSHRSLREVTPELYRQSEESILGSYA